MTMISLDKLRADLAEESYDGATELLRRTSAETGWPIIEGCLVPEPGVWHADDGNCEVTYDGTAKHLPLMGSGLAAARAYAETGDWGDIGTGITLDIDAWRMGIDIDGDWCRVDEDRHRITLLPDDATLGRDSSGVNAAG